MESYEEMPLSRAYRAKRRAEAKAMRAARRRATATRAVAVIGVALLIHIVGESILALI